MNTHVLTLSLGRNILIEGNRERLRIHAYAEHLGSLHVVVLSRKVHGFSTASHESALHVYPTNSTNRFMMLIDAFFLSRRIISEMQGKRRIISAQDPLEIGWLCFLIAKITGAYFHVQVHGDYFSSSAWIGKSPTRWLRRRIGLALLKRAPAIRVVSERIKTSLVLRGVSAPRITVLPIRPELEMFLAQKGADATIKRNSFLFIGRLSPEKNIPRIIRAFALVRSVYIEATLCIVGEGGEKQKIVELVRKLNLTDSVILKSWTEDVAKEMFSADTFLLASLHEAYGLTLVEAMAVGMPLVTTDVGCVGEIVQDGVHGLVVYEDSDRAYADAMSRLYTDVALRQKYKDAGRATAQALASVSGDIYAQAWVTTVCRSCDGV